MTEFVAWPKTARLFRDIIVTEKLDGTNSAVHITEIGDYTGSSAVVMVDVDGVRYAVGAQSRKRMITPGKSTDNFGFAGWVYDNAAELVSLLGEGLHFGEWWGKGIQRGYGVPGRSFSLFNTDKHRGVHAHVGDFDSVPVTVGPVPVIYQGPFSEARIHHALLSLKVHGSHAAPGFANPEGICVWHSQSRDVYKVTLDNQDAGKWEAAA